jgi:hypothetical protein
MKSFKYEYFELWNNDLNRVKNVSSLSFNNVIEKVTTEIKIEKNYQTKCSCSKYMRRKNITDLYESKIFYQ